MKIWILNHYATNMCFEGGGRHQWFAKYLIRKGHDVKIFCANTFHNRDEAVDISQGIFTEKEGQDQVPYVFVKARPYQGNGKTRILNMMDYARNVKKVMKFFAEHEGNPDIILASSVHPLTLVSGIKMAKKFHIPCICEVRDLWPESIVAYTQFTKSNPIIKALYRLEKWIYKRADSLIFTVEGGKDYIVDKGWEDSVKLSKIFYINNGVDLEQYRANLGKFRFEDVDLDAEGQFNVVYTGSIRKANDISTLIRCMEHLKNTRIKLLIFGDGEQRNELETYCRLHQVNNVVFKGKVDKEYIPSILSKSDLNVLNYQKGGLWKYGGSQNKFFEYLASGTPVLANIKMGYDPIEKYECGMAEEFENDDEYSKAILSFANMSRASYDRICKNVKRVAEQYDFKRLTDDLEKVVQQTFAINI